MSFNVPVGEGILWVVVLGAGDLNLLETPLRQVDISGTQITPKRSMPESECGGQGSDLRPIVGGDILDNFNGEMVLIIADGGVAVTRDFLINLGDWCRDIVRVEVAAGLRVNQTENVAVGNKLRWCFCVKLGLAAVGVEKPLVVGILVMVASDLLLSGALWVCLDVRMEKSTTVSHVLNRCAGSVGNLKRAVLSNLRTAKVSLEQGAHLGISWATVFEDREMSRK